MRDCLLFRRLLLPESIVVLLLYLHHRHENKLVKRAKELNATSKRLDPMVTVYCILPFYTLLAMYVFSKLKGTLLDSNLSENIDMEINSPNWKCKEE